MDGTNKIGFDNENGFRDPPSSVRAVNYLTQRFAIPVFNARVVPNASNAPRFGSPMGGPAFVAAAPPITGNFGLLVCRFCTWIWFDCGN
jgi:hypothetical protein